MNNVKLQKVESSSINAVGYDTGHSRLTIQFHNGRTYEYYDVPEWIWNGITKPCESVGKFFNASIRGVFTYKERR